MLLRGGAFAPAVAEDRGASAVAVTEGAAFALGAAVGAAVALSLGAAVGVAFTLSLGAAVGVVFTLSLGVGLDLSELWTALGDGLSGLASEAAVSAGSVVTRSAFAGGEVLRPATAPITIATNTIAEPRSATRAFDDRPREEARSTGKGGDVDGCEEGCATPVGEAREGGGSLKSGAGGCGGADDEWAPGAEVTTAVIVSLVPEASRARGLGSAAGR